MMNHRPRSAKLLETDNTRGGFIQLQFPKSCNEFLSYLNSAPFGVTRVTLAALTADLSVPYATTGDFDGFFPSRYQLKRVTAFDFVVIGLCPLASLWDSHSVLCWRGSRSSTAGSRRQCDIFNFLGIVFDNYHRIASFYTEDSARTAPVMVQLQL